MDNSDKQNPNTLEPLSDWSVVSENEEFKDLMAAKARFPSTSYATRARKTESTPPEYATRHEP